MICTQPEFIPGSTRLSSLNESSPFSCSHNRPDFGSKAMPKLLRMPYAASGGWVQGYAINKTQ